MQRDLSIIVHARPTSVTREQRRSVRRELDRLESHALLEYEMRTWPAEFERDDAPEDLRSTVREFERWSDREGVSLRPCLERRSYERSITDESGEVVSLPGLALATYDAGELAIVVPYTDSELHVTVDDYLAWLRAAARSAERERIEPGVAE